MRSGLPMVPGVAVSHCVSDGHCRARTNTHSLTHLHFIYVERGNDSGGEANEERDAMVLRTRGCERGISAQRW